MVIGGDTLIPEDPGTEPSEDALIPGSGGPPPPPGSLLNILGKAGSGGAGEEGDKFDPYASTIHALRNQFPWIEIIGLWSTVEEAIRNDESWEQIYARIQQSDQYKQMFGGMVDSRGFRRFPSERAYLEELENYRQVLRTWGRFDPTQDDPEDYASLISQGLSPQELNTRLEMYSEVVEGSQELKDAMYVYAGLNVTDDDLYRAMTSTEYRQAMESTYNQAVAHQNLDYETFITRATERGIERTVEALQRMKQLGLLTGAAVAEMQSIDPNFAREMMGALFTDGADPTKSLSLSELTVAFEYAMLGSAASEQGLVMPTKERIAELRQAGVDRTRALSSYGRFSSQSGMLDAMAQRSNVLDRFDQSLFEEAVFLARGGAARELNRALGQEAALGRSGQGGFQQSMTGDSRLEQVGRRI